MSKKNSNYWLVDDCSTKFDSLFSAKIHLDLFSVRDRHAYNGSYIYHFCVGILVSSVEIRVDSSGKLTYGRCVHE